MKVEIVKGTPAWAKAILDPYEKALSTGQARNRPLSNEAADQYLNDMSHGHWLLNNQGIYIDEETGYPLDGRTRLWGLAKAPPGTVVEILVCTGPAEHKVVSGAVLSVIDTIDRGRPRSIGQQLHIEGVKYSFCLAAASRMIACMCAKDVYARLSVATCKEILNVYKHLQGFPSFLQKGTGRNYAQGFLVGPLSMYYKVDSDRCENFIHSFTTGQDLPEGSPVLALRTYFRTHTNRGRDGSWKACCATALALQHFHKKNKVNAIRYSELGVEWLMGEQRNNVRKIREILGYETGK